MDEEALANNGSTEAIANADSGSRETNDASAHMMEHLGSHRQYWRDIILGVNDGLVSTFLLVAGVAGGGLSSQNILLTAIAGAIAGAVSMCAGEFVATKSQNEVMKGELALERKHVEQFLELELAQLDPLLELIGIEGDDRLLEEIKAYYRGKPLALLKIMTALEFGVLATEERSPFRAGITSCGLFVAGSVPSVLPFAFSGENPQAGLFAAAALTIVSLMVVGAIKTWATRTKCVSASVENLIIAGFGGGFAYGVGVLFEKLVNG